MNKKIFGVLILFLLTGCLAETSNGPVELIPLNSPVDASNGIRHQARGDIIGEYHHRTPRDPGDWQKLNREQTNPLGQLR